VLEVVLPADGEGELLGGDLLAVLFGRGAVGENGLAISWVGPGSCRDSALRVYKGEARQEAPMI